MTFVDVAATLVLVAIIGGAVAYIIKAKKSGQKCIGCPSSSTCNSSKCGGNCCNCHDNKKA